MDTNESKIYFENILDKLSETLANKVATEVDIETMHPCWVSKTGVKTYPSGEPYIVLPKDIASDYKLTPTVSYARFLYRMTCPDSLVPRRKVRRNRSVCTNDTCINPAHKIFDHSVSNEVIGSDFPPEQEDPWNSLSASIQLSQGI